MSIIGSLTALRERSEQVAQRAVRLSIRALSGSNPRRIYAYKNPIAVLRQRRDFWWSNSNLKRIFSHCQVVFVRNRLLYSIRCT